MMVMLAHWHPFSNKLRGFIHILIASVLDAHTDEFLRYFPEENSSRTPNYSNLITTHSGLIVKREYDTF